MGIKDICVVYVRKISSKSAVNLKVVDISNKSRVEIGSLGERIAADYLSRHGFSVLDRNVALKTGELDIVARKADVLHFVEVKTILANALPEDTEEDAYGPADNLHEAKVRKVARTGEWYVLANEWEGEWQVDGCLVWLRRADGRAKIRYLPQIV